MADELTDLDAAPADELATAFVLPEYITGDLAVLYQTMVSKLRQEAAGLPMNTIQQILIERIATFYVQIKFRESSLTGFTTVNQQKEFNAHWVTLTQEFNRLLANSQDKLRDALLMEVQKVVSSTLDLISDEDERRTARRHIANEFASIGL